MSDRGRKQSDDVIPPRKDEKRRRQQGASSLTESTSSESNISRLLNISPDMITSSPDYEGSMQDTIMPSISMPTDTHSPRLLSDYEPSTRTTTSDSFKYLFTDSDDLSPITSDPATISVASKELSMDSSRHQDIEVRLAPLMVPEIDSPLEAVVQSEVDVSMEASKQPEVESNVPTESSTQPTEELDVPAEHSVQPDVLNVPTISIRQPEADIELEVPTDPSNAPQPESSLSQRSERPRSAERRPKITIKAPMMALEKIAKKFRQSCQKPPRSTLQSLLPHSKNLVAPIGRGVTRLQLPSTSTSHRTVLDSAAAKLKHTEGAVKLTVCTPNLKDKKEDAPLAEETGSATTSVPAGSAASRSASGNQTPDPGLAAAGSSRPHSPRPAPSPVRTEPPADPATAPIQPNQDTIIEITTESQSLGLFLLGGSDTSINGPAAVVLDVIQDRPVGRDGRLQRGDQIRAACGIQLTEAMTEDRLNMTIKQWAPKLKFTVFRPDPIQYEDIEVDVNRKQGPLGFSFAAFSNDRGIYITQILPGSPAEQDGRLRRGDHILTVDGKDVSSAEFTAASVALKLIGPKVSIKIRRLKIVR